MDYSEIFTETDVIVLGDLIMDQFIYGEPARISREAPVLILDENDRKINPGGAGNAALNISALGGNTELISLAGNDNCWESLKQTLEDHDISTAGMIVDKNIQTAVKTRIMAGSDQVVRQQVVRIDKVKNTGKKLSADSLNNIKNYIKSIISRIDALLFSDYGLGLLSQELIDSIISLCKKNGIPVIADSRYGLLNFNNVTIATPNLEEAGRAAGMELSGNDEIISAGKKILNKISSDYLLLTRGKNGMTLFYDEGGYDHIPVVNQKEVYDVTGAGDTVAAALVLGLGAGLDVLKSVKIANSAASIAVTKEGAAPVYLEELIEVVS